MHILKVFDKYSWNTQLNPHIDILGERCSVMSVFIYLFTNTLAEEDSQVHAPGLVSAHPLLSCLG